ncbi:TolC family protein [Brevundimonas sp.]|uniref:TolC family protein n=1 Tax=Brevundimonas sp. TaxID=1871086 RepID=UPI002D63AE50|nr:TolC family protein [Brevundimonas sp.]HYC73628.1 TolC family protein [Brevundimonas sp.]
MTTRSPLRFLTATAGASLLLASCAVGPKAPDATLPPSASGAFIGAATPAVTAEAARDDWWRLYDDPVLDGLVRQALVENNELEAAAANLRAVRATLAETRGARLPRLNTSASATYSRQSAGSIPPGGGPLGPQDEVETYDAGFDVSYEIDLWGRVAAAIRAARADAAAAEAALDIVRVTVAAETARAYADACSANAQIEVAERTIELQSGTVDLTRRLLDAGSGNGLDVARARSALELVRAALPPLRAQRDGALFRLATLTGRTPAEASDAARVCLRPPQLSQPIPVGDGAALLARRPDVRRAERQVAAAAARINVAVASLYPTISLGGSAGATALDIGELGDEDNFRFSVGPLISWSFTTPGVNRARVERADANTQAALAAFDQTVLVALQETETALANYANELDRRSALQAARDQAANAARLSRLRFDAGADSFLAVLDAERTLAAADAQLAASEALVTTYQIALFKALAGGWSEG